MAGSNNGSTPSSSDPPPPSPNNTAENDRDHHPSPGDPPDHNSRSGNDHPNDAGAPQDAVTGRGRRPRPRPRGRPPGAKNKPKPQVVITRESPSALRLHVFHVPSGADVAGTVVSFSRRQRVGVVILSCCGVVANVSLREPLTAAAGAPPSVTAFTIPGRHEMLLLRGFFLPDHSLPGGATGLAICLTTGGGQVLSGNVVGPLEASGPVTLVTAIFSPSTVTYDWLLEEGEPAARATAGGAGLGVQLHRSSGADAGVCGGGGWPSSLDPVAAAAAAAAAAAPIMPVYNLRPDLVANKDQIPDAVFADPWASSAAHPPAPPSNYK